MSKASRWVEKVKAVKEYQKRLSQEAEEMRPEKLIVDSAGRLHMDVTDHGACFVRFGDQIGAIAPREAVMAGKWLLATFGEPGTDYPAPQQRGGAA